MAAKTWEADFRYPAIQASMPLIRDGYLDDPFACPSSFCIPVAKKPAVGWTPGKIILLALILGFLLLGSGAALASVGAKNGQPDPMMLVIGAVCSLSGMACFFTPLLLDREIVGWLIGERAHRLVERAGMTQIMTAEISDADRSRMKLSIDGDDFVLIYPDFDHHRLLLEGTAARYQIRAEDVVKILPFEFMNYIGVEVVCRIGDDAHLHMAVARVSLLFEFIRQAPLFFFLRGRISNKLYAKFEEVLRSP